MADRLRQAVFHSDPLSVGGAPVNGSGIVRGSGSSKRSDIRSSQPSTSCVQPAGAGLGLGLARGRGTWRRTSG
jgi:hypothetical protein